MTLEEAIELWNRSKKDYPGGTNFRNKSLVEGFSCGDFLLPIEYIGSKEWAIDLRSLDEEFNNVCNGLLDELK